MELNITVKELARIIKGQIIYIKKNTIIKTFITDTRNMKENDIFWALKGKNFDGNDFVENAINKNAKGIISSKKIDRFGDIEFYIYIKDSLDALHRLAKYHYSKYNIKTISITGSNGKTTTKEMIYSVLSSHKNTVYNPKNLNNEYGVPLCVLESNKKHFYGVFEIGASRKGDVKKLAKIIKPDVAIITTIAPEHLEFFKTMKNVFETETEVINELKDKNSKVIINGDNEYLKKLKNNKRTISFGFNPDNDLVIEEKKDFSIFKYMGKVYKIKLKSHITHNYLNAASAFISGMLFKIKPSKIIKALQKFEGVPLRMQTIKRKKSKIILDAYNANPQSMALAIKDISKKSKKYAFILGDMKELGRYSKKYHIELAKEILKHKPVYIFLVGTEIKPCYDFLKEKIKNVKYYKDTDSFIKEVKRFIEEHKDTDILIKASRSMKFEKFV